MSAIVLPRLLASEQTGADARLCRILTSAKYNNYSSSIVNLGTKTTWKQRGNNIIIEYCTLMEFTDHDATVNDHMTSRHCAVADAGFVIGGARAHENFATTPLKLPLNASSRHVVNGSGSAI